MFFRYPILWYQFESFHSFPVRSCLYGNNSSHMEQRDKFMFMPCYSSHCCVSAYQLIILVFSKLFWWHNNQPWVPSFGQLPKPLGNSQIISWGTKCFAPYNAGNHSDQRSLQIFPVIWLVKTRSVDSYSLEKSHCDKCIT